MLLISSFIRGNELLMAISVLLKMKILMKEGLCVVIIKLGLENDEIKVL